MPVMRASRPESKQKIGDVLYEQLKCEHGTLAGKLVGMLLEGLPHERLATLCHEPAALQELVSQAAPLLEIQRQELASQPVVTADGIELLVLLVLLASPSLTKSPLSLPDTPRPWIFCRRRIFCGAPRTKARIEPTPAGASQTWRWRVRGGSKLGSVGPSSSGWHPCWRRETCGRRKMLRSASEICAAIGNDDDLFDVDLSLIAETTLYCPCSLHPFHSELCVEPEICVCWPTTFSQSAQPSRGGRPEPPRQVDHLRPCGPGAPRN